MPFVSFLVLLIVCACAAAQSPVEIIAKPDAVYIERTPAGRELNFDFLMVNNSPNELKITEIEVSVLDRHGALVIRKFVDGNGVRPSIDTVANRELKPGQTTLVFNPFHTFAVGIDLASMVYKFKFETVDEASKFESQIEIRPAEYVSKTDLILPTKGRSIIYDGHDFYAHHRRFDYEFSPIKAFGFKTNFMRYSYDFVPINKVGEMFRGTEAENTNYIGYGADLFATGSGMIVAAVDNQPDDRKFDQAKLAADRMVLFGNYIVIDHGNGEFSLYAHLKQNSLTVKTGQRVRQGQVIAKLGASGSANFPHLHYELQSGPNSNAEGLPSYFRNFERILGSRRISVKSGTVSSGDIIYR